jgi:hypothetical protein
MGSSLHEDHVFGNGSQEAERRVSGAKLDRLLIDLLSIPAMEENLSGDNSLVLVRFRVADEHPFRCIPDLHFLNRDDFARVHDDLLA